MLETKEKQYTVSLEYRESHGQEKLGLMMNQCWYDDPRRLSFVFSRYKFVSKMLEGFENVIEIGCGDAFPSRIVQQAVKNLTLTDFDPHFINDIRNRELERWQFKDIILHDLILGGPIPGRYDAAYAIDVLEHINPKDEAVFIKNICSSLTETGTFIVGIPSIESQEFASTLSKAGHVNCQSLPQLKTNMQQYFHNVYMFSMNDEVVHTGYHKMAHYIFALCCNKKNKVNYESK